MLFITNQNIVIWHMTMYIYMYKLCVLDVTEAHCHKQSCTLAPSHSGLLCLSLIFGFSAFWFWDWIHHAWLRLSHLLWLVLLLVDLKSYSHLDMDFWFILFGHGAFIPHQVIMAGSLGLWFTSKGTGGNQPRITYKMATVYTWLIGAAIYLNRALFLVKFCNYNHNTNSNCSLL